MKKNILVKIFNDAYQLMLEENLRELVWQSRTERIYLKRKMSSKKPVTSDDVENDKDKPYVEQKEKIKEPVIDTNKDYVRSPINGVFYKSPSPGAPAFISPPCDVKKGDTLCIIEAMKVMNEIKAEKDMKISKVLVEDTKEVKEGQELFEIS